MRGIVVAMMALGLASLSSAQAQTDLQANTRDLVFASLDLVFAVEDMEGAVQSLEIEETETEIRIELAADVLFDFDSADLRAEAEAALQNVAGIIREHEGADVRVEGHTDAKGSEDYNQRLSEQRAESVRDWLTSAEGLSGTDFEITGFGESRPAAPNEKPDGSDDPEGRQKNRRVEIVVSKE